MALATYQHTPIKDLDDLLRYLTEDLGYTKGVAIYSMNQHYHGQLDGRLVLEKQDLIRDNEPCGGWVTTNANLWDLKLDRDGHVQVIPRIKLWRKARYRIAEGCDARAIWPPGLPAPQTAAEQQQEDKAGPSAGQLRQKPLTPKEWLKGEIKRREDAGDIPKEITEFSVQLHSEMEKAVRAGTVKGLIEARTIETHLRDTTSLFAKKKRSPKS
jgi:hypothetical protein